MIQILIPTNDNITVAPNFEKASAYRMVTTFNGLVKDDKFIRVENSYNNKSAFGIDVYGDNKKEQVALLLNISSEAEKTLQNLNFKVYHTQETNIINALNSFVKSYAECDYCCCP